MLSRALILCLCRLIFLSVCTGSQVQVRTAFFDGLVSPGEYYMLSLLRDGIKTKPTVCEDVFGTQVKFDILSSGHLNNYAFVLFAFRCDLLVNY